MPQCLSYCTKQNWLFSRLPGSNTDFEHLNIDVIFLRTSGSESFTMFAIPMNG